MEHPSPHDVPALPAGGCHVWWARTGSADPREPDVLLGLLDSHERARWSRLKRPEDRTRYLLAHGLARVVLGSYLGVPAAGVRLVATCGRCGGPHGKPRVADPGADAELSISHSGERVVVAVARGHGSGIGVDVERVTPGQDVTSVARLALSAAEREVLESLAPAERPVALLTWWTRKEALLKATGDGLAVSPSSLTVTPPEQPPALLAWAARPPLRDAAHLTDLHPGPGHVACLAVLGTPLQVTEYAAGGVLAAI